MPSATAMTTLGWDSTELLRVNLEIEEVRLRTKQALIEISRHRANAPLFIRWDNELRSIMPQYEALRKQFAAIAANSDRAACTKELTDVARTHPDVLKAKRRLEYLILCTNQHYEDCARAIEIGNVPAIRPAYEAFNRGRAYCLNAIERFRRTYLPAAVL